MITQELVRSLFDYRDGELYWRVQKGSRALIGDKAGSVVNNGYYSIMINGKSYLTHRIIYLHHYDYLPKYLDHIDNNKLNNNIENLREITISQNAMNQNPSKNSTSEYKGVYWNKHAKKWQAQIVINGKLKYLGLFNDEKTAAFIYNVYAREAFGEYAKLNEMEVR